LQDSRVGKRQLATKGVSVHQEVSFTAWGLVIARSGGRTAIDGPLGLDVSLLPRPRASFQERR
jgi:hypothetical protein